MASNFPNAVDSFINPQFTKVNGVDFVKAEHINDLQDAVRNIQLSIIGSGVSLNFASNNYVPPTADIKSAIEILDGEVKQREDDLQIHLDASMPTDATQHHANVIEVTTIGNLSSNRLQWALEEHQADIDAIMSGGFVEGVTLDSRYLLASGPATVTGTFTVQDTFTAESDVVLGQSLSNTVTIGGDTSIGRDLTVAGESEFMGDVKLPDVSKLGASSNIQYSHLAFGADYVALRSIKDIEFQLDTDDSIDGASEEGEFRILNGNSTSIFSLLENGQLTVSTKVSTTILESTSHLEFGSGETGRLENDLLATDRTNFVIQVDRDNNSINDYFAVTRDGDNGSLDNATDLLLKAKDTELIAGNHVLKRSVPERGYFGIKFYSDNAGGRFQGYGVNFKARMLTAPSSVTLNVDAVRSSNYNNLSITDLNEFGFFVECDSVAVGNCEVKGTYETVGN